MSWWDYGYQITAMANRTILVDNNTWNNTHISRVGQVSQIETVGERVPMCVCVCVWWGGGYGRGVPDHCHGHPHQAGGQHHLE